MPRAVLALAHNERDESGESERILVNMYAEENSGDPARAVRLATTPGSIDRDTGNVIQGNIRGLAQSDAFASGKVLILDGTTLRTWVPSSGTFGTITGTVSGSDRADMAFTQTELAVLSGGTLYVSDGSTIAAAGDVDFPTTITSIAPMSQRILMTSSDGKWYYTAVLDIDNITGLSFYSAESAPDDLIAVRVLGEIAYLCGGKTIELWYADPTNANDPFSRASNVVRRGVLCRDGIQILQNTLVFVAEDRTVCQLVGVEPRVISKPWVVRALKGVAASDIIASVYEDENHAFYCLNTPNDCMVFDLLTGEWHKRKTNGSDTWDWVRIISQGDAHYAAKRTGSTFVELDRDYATDEMPSASVLGTDIIREFTAHIPHEWGRPALGAIMLEGSKGVGLASGDGSDPVVQMRLSKDNGNTWTSFRDRKLGAQGVYDQRSKWERNGRGRRPQTVCHFKIIEPVKFDVTGVVWGERS